MFTQADKITIAHGERVTVRCRELGRYKLIGDPFLQCRNGEWSGKTPSCLPTTSISNYTGKILFLNFILCIQQNYIYPHKFITYIHVLL